MRTLKFVLFAVLLAVVPLALADPFNPFNTRPVPVGSAPSGEQNLQDILNAQCPGCFNVNTDQSSVGYWRLETAPPTGIFPIVIVEWAGWSPSNVVGIFSGDPVTRDVFLGPAAGGASAGILWTGLDTGVITPGLGYEEVVLGGPFSGISYLGFGFYLRPQGGSTYYYTVDDLNPNKSPQVLTFRKTGSNTWFLAFEDRLVNGGNSDRDYNDFVMKVESIVPVPEPAAILLVGSVLLLVGRRLRARA